MMEDRDSMETHLSYLRTCNGTTYKFKFSLDFYMSSSILVTYITWLPIYKLFFLSQWLPYNYWWSHSLCFIHEYHAHFYNWRIVSLLTHNHNNIPYSKMDGQHGFGNLSLGSRDVNQCQLNWLLTITGDQLLA